MNLLAARALCFCALSAGLAGCVTLPPNAPRSPQDPYESWNRGVYKLNTKVDNAVTKPLAKGYVRIVPQPIRTGVTNFFGNLHMTTVLVNDALAGKPLAAATDLGRLLLNTTVGVGGLLDPATEVGLAHNEADFGLTLARWGVHSGPFIELPVFGPSDLRDAPSRVVDAYTSPLQYVHKAWIKYPLVALDLLDTRAGLLSLEPTLATAYDPYQFVRDAYLARRAFMSGHAPLKQEDEPTLDPDAPGDAPPSKQQEPVTGSEP
jgi:phospholipid-binding lipoprotein MlaA